MADTKGSIDQFRGYAIEELDLLNLGKTPIPVDLDRDLVVTALQALWRERNQALRSAENVAELRREAAPDPRLFGVSEVTQALKACGAAPMPF